MTVSRLDGRCARIIVDTSSNVPSSLLALHRMLEVPTLVNFGTESYRNNVDLSAEDFYERLIHGKQIPTTSQPPPQFFADAYAQAFAEGAEHILVFTASSKFSGTFNSAQTATQAWDRSKFTLWDSDSASMGSGWQALVAARLIERTIERDELIAKLTAIREKTRGYATVETLKYAARSGRLSNFQAGLGDLLQVKAILEVTHGRFAAIGRVRGRTKSFRELIDRFHADMGDQPVNAAVAHAHALQDAETLAADLRARVNVRELHLVDVGPAIATLAGPGTVGIFGHPAALAE